MARLLRHQESLKITRARVRKPEDKLEFSGCDLLAVVEALIADDEVVLLRVSPREGSFVLERFEKGYDFRAHSGPQTGSWLLEQHPARSLLDAAHHRQREAAPGQIAPFALHACLRNQRTQSDPAAWHT